MKFVTWIDTRANCTCGGFAEDLVFGEGDVVQTGAEQKAEEGDVVTPSLAKRVASAGSAKSNTCR